MLTLRPYQIEPVRKAIEFFREDSPEPALMVMPTAWGKSVLAAEAAAACPDPILVVQPTKELLEQNLNKYRLLCGDLAPAAVYSASIGKKDIDYVTFATIGSIKNEGERFRALGFRKMLIDEAHLYPRKEQSMLGQFLKESAIRQVLGITATPLKLESFSERQGKKFDKWSELIMLTNPSPDGTFFKRILHVSQISEMTSRGFWSPLRYEILPFDRHALEYNTAGSDYTEESLISSYVANNTRENIVAALDYHTERRHVLVFVPTVEEAEALASFYPESAALSGKTPKKERAEIIRRFREGEIRVIFNVIVLSTGFDYTKIDMIVTGYSAASMAKHYQVVGRGVRIDPDKRDCLIVDAGGNVERFGRVEDIRYEYDGKWRMYGTDDTLLSGIPVYNIGDIKKGHIEYGLATASRYDAISFGKHKGKAFDDLPVMYLSWLAGHADPAYGPWLRSRAAIALESHIKDTRMDPPMTEMPDGKYAGEHIGTVPKQYLKWYLDSKEWNETNDSLHRGILNYL